MSRRSLDDRPKKREEEGERMRRKEEEMEKLKREIAMLEKKLKGVKSEIDGLKESAKKMGKDSCKDKVSCVV